MAISLDDILKAAKKSQMKFRLAALVFDDDEIASVGHNRPFVTQHLADRGYRSVHAEIDAIRHLDPRRLRDTSKLVMVVARIKRDGSLGNAKPCRRCFSAIKKAGIRKVYFTNEDGGWTYMHIDG